MSDFTDIPLTRNDGGTETLGDYAGKVLLVVNVASKCGLTPQYEALQSLYRTRKDGGLEVLAFPANDFKGQEPGTDAEIAEFCQTTYDVTFPLFAKVTVTGPDRHPLYDALIAAQPDAIGDGPMRDRLKAHGVEAEEGGGILWNFEKFLVGRHGKVLARFAPDVAPDDPRVLEAVDQALEQDVG